MDSSFAKLFEYPPNGWEAESSWDAGFLALAMHKVSSQVGIKAFIHNPSNPYLLGYDKILQFSGVRIEFKDQDYGCSLHIVIADQKEIDRGFFVIWKYFVDKGLFWGGPYIKDLTSENNKRDPKVEELQNDGKHNNAQVDSIPANVKNGNEKKESKYSQVEKRHEYIWRIIKPVAERAGTYGEMRSLIKAKKQLGKNKDEQISVPNNATLKIIVEKYSKKQADTE